MDSCPGSSGKRLLRKEGQAGRRRAHACKTEGLWLKCDGCREIIWKKDLEANQNVCPKCGAHFRIDAVTRLQVAASTATTRSSTRDLASSDPLDFVDPKPYRERLQAMQQATSLADALISATGTLDGRAVQICAMEPKFIGGSMGAWWAKRSPAPSSGPSTRRRR